MAIHKRKFNPEDDLGFGTQPVIKSQRLINQDGSVNVKRKGLSPFSTSNNYHTLITMAWGKFWAMVLSGYLAVNIIFFPMHFLGLAGMPRRIPDYPDAYAAFNSIATYGFILNTIAVIVLLILMTESFLKPYLKEKRP